VSVPRTYRYRLVFYIGALLLFLVSALVLSYRSSSKLVLKAAENHTVRIAQQIGRQLHIEARDLSERARMMRDNTDLTSYFYIAATLGTDPGALRDVYRRHFGWLQIDRAVVMTGTGQVFIGAEHADLREALKARGLTASRNESQFYINKGDGLELVAVSPLSYRSMRVGTIAITKALDARWMKDARQMSGGHLILVRDGHVVHGTVSDEEGQAGSSFEPRDGVVHIGGEPYLVQRIPVGDHRVTSSLWFALSQNELTTELREQRDFMLGLALLGCTGGLFIGFMMLRNFSDPLSRLVRLMQEVRKGHLPEIPRVPARDEIGYLTNSFSEMVTSLREQQGEVQRVHDELERKATTDALTGLYNRRYLYDLYPKLWSEAQRHGKQMTLVIVDLDYFKRINDRHGHVAGDQVLVHVARVMRDNCRVSDFLFRLGGEEFLVLTSGDDTGGQALAEKIRAALEREPCRGDGQNIPVTASFGVAQAVSGDGLEGLSQVLARADLALYSAKQAGRNRVAVWYPQRQSA
jgi:diguanylate cyclase (GGDEF)-like protein